MSVFPYLKAGWGIVSGVAALSVAAGIGLSASSAAAQTDDMKIRALLHLHKATFDSCKEAEDVDAQDCQASRRIERALEDLEVCRVPGSEGHFQLCAEYRHYQVLPQMKGYNFGFSWLGGRNFSTRFTSYEPTYDGDIELRDVGSLNILCDKGDPVVWLYIDGGHPNYPQLEEDANLVGMVDGNGQRDFISGYFEREGQQGVFGIGGETAALRILRHLLESLDAVGLQEDLKISLWPATEGAPSAKLELAFGGYSSGNVDLLSYRPEIRALLTHMIEYCEPS